MARAFLRQAGAGEAEEGALGHLDDDEIGRNQADDDGEERSRQWDEAERRGRRGERQHDAAEHGDDDRQDEAEAGTTVPGRRPSSPDHEDDERLGGE